MTTARIIVLADTTEASAKMDELAVKSDATASAISDAGSKAGSGFSSAIGDATNKSGGFLSDLSSKMSNLGIPGAQSIGKFGDALAQADTKGKALSETMNEIGKMALQGGLAAFAVAAYEGVKGAMALQKQMEMIHTQAGASAAEVQRMTGAVLGMAASVGQGPLQLAQALYHVESVGLRGAKALAVLKTSAEGAAIGGANLTDVTNALDAAVVSGIAGAQNYKAAMGELNATVGAGDMTMQDMADAMGTGLLATAKTYGLTITDVGGALATFGDNNLRGAAAATRLRQVIMTMAAPSKSAAEALYAIGLSQTQLASDMKSGGLVKAIQDLKTHLEASGATAQQQGLILSRAFGGGKTSSGVLLLMQELTRLQTKTQDVANGGKRFGADWNATTKTLSFQFEQLKSGASALVDKLGMDLIPVIEKMGEFVSANKGVFMDLAEIIGGVLAVSVLKFVGSSALGFIQAVGQMVVKSVTLVASLGTTAAETQAANAVVTESTVQTLGTQTASSAAAVVALQRESEAYLAMAEECRAASLVVTESGVTVDEAMAQMAVEAENLAATYRSQLAVASGSVDELAASTAASGAAADAAMTGMADGATAAAGIFDTALGSTGVGLAIVGLGVALTALATHWKQVWPVMANLADEAANTIDHGLNAIIATAEHVANALLDVADAFGAGIKKINVQANTLPTNIHFGTQQTGGSGGGSRGATGPQYGPVNLNAQPATTTQWAQQFIDQLGGKMAYSANDPRVKFLAGWEQQEGTFNKGNQNNPLDITSPENQAGATQYNSFGPKDQYHVYHFPNFQSGAQATDQFLSHGYGNILNLLRGSPNGSTIAQLTSALGATNWSGGNSAQYAQEVAANAGHPVSSALSTYLGSQSGSTALSTALTPSDIAMEDRASGMLGSMMSASRVPTTLVGQESGIARLMAAVHADAGAPGLANQMSATKNPRLAAMAARLESTWSGLTSKLATIVNTDTQTGMSQLSTLSSAATNDNLSTLRADMTGAFRQKLDVLVRDLDVVNKNMAEEITRQYAAVAAQFKAVEGFNKTAKEGQVEQNRATTTQAVAQKMSDASAAIVTHMQDMQTTVNAAAAAMVTKINDVSKIAQDAAAAVVTKVQDVVTNAQTDAQNRATIIQASATRIADITQNQATLVQDQAQLQSDTVTAMATQVTDAAHQMSDAITAQSQAVQDATQAMNDAASAQAQALTDQATVQSDVLNERGKYGLNLIAQQAQVALAVQQQTDHAAEAAAQAHLDQVTTQQHQLTAIAQQKLDQITTQTAATTALGQEKADTVAITTQQTIAAAQAKADSLALKEAELVAQAQAHADAITLADAGKVAAAQAHLDQVTLKAAAQVASAQAHADAVATAEAVKVASAQSRADTAVITASNAQTAASIAEAMAQFLPENKQLQAQSTLALVQGQAAAAEASANAIVSQVQSAANQANANAQRSLANVTNATNRATAAATARLDQVTSATNRANEKAQELLGVVQNLATVSNANAQAQLSQAQAAATLQQAQSQAALARLQANGALQQAQAQAALSQAQATSNLQISVAQQQLAAANNMGAVEEAQLQGIYNVDEAMAQTQYAGSGIQINIVNQGGGNAQEIADAVGWELRTRVA